MTGQGADGSQGGSVQPGTAKIEALKPSKNWECHGTNIIYVCIYIYMHVGYIFIYIYIYMWDTYLYIYIYIWDVYV